MKKIIMLVGLALTLSLVGCNGEASQEDKDKRQVQQQQKQYAAAQPVPVFNWSLERDMLIQLYNIRNLKAATHTVWRGDTSVVEGDCASIGYGLPYDTSITNPLQPTGNSAYALTSIGQAEPNGVFASTNTAATWVFCVTETGSIEPIYVEAKVTGYPYPVTVDYQTNRVTKAGKSSVSIKVK